MPENLELLRGTLDLFVSKPSPGPDARIATSLDRSVTKSQLKSRKALSPACTDGANVCSANGASRRQRNARSMLMRAAPLSVRHAALVWGTLHTNRVHALVHRGNRINRLSDCRSLARGARRWTPSCVPYRSREELVAQGGPAKRRREAQRRFVIKRACTGAKLTHRHVNGGISRRLASLGAHSLCIPVSWAATLALAVRDLALAIGAKYSVFSLSRRAPAPLPCTRSIVMRAGDYPS